MMQSSTDEASHRLHSQHGGDQAAWSKLVPLASYELHSLSHHPIVRELAVHALQTRPWATRLVLGPSIPKKSNGGSGRTSMQYPPA